METTDLRPQYAAALLLAACALVGPVPGRAQAPAAAPAVPRPAPPSPGVPPAPKSGTEGIVATPAETPDYPDARWVPASPANYQKADRPAQYPINMVVIHDIEGSAESAIQWFQNPRAEATAHYVVNSFTGQVTQMVKEHDVAWHSGNRYVNQHSIGIEHEGFAYRPGYYNPTEYEASARLVRSITTRYGIPRDRTHIIGHSEVPNPFHAGLFGGSGGHTDPGPFWDWDRFMTLVRSDSRLVDEQIPRIIHPGEMQEMSVSLQNLGDDPWPTGVKAAEDASVYRQGVVALGTWGPQGRTSPFFNLKTWISPRLAASAGDNPVAPGATGKFTFSLLGSREYGDTIEQFRLIRYPAAPDVPVGFGDIITAAVHVAPWELIQVAAAPAFSAPGWNAAGIPAHPLYWRKTAPDSAAATPAEWKIPVPIGGNWDVYARWPSGNSHTRKAFFTVLASDGAHAIPVDQQTGGGWHKLGRFSLPGDQPAVIRLSPHGGSGIVVADGVRLVGPAPVTAQSPSPSSPVG